MLRVLSTSFITAVCLLAGQQAHACSVAPQYLNGEFGSDGVLLGNISENADKIIIGRFIESDVENSVSFLVKKRIKPRLRSLSKKKIPVRFHKVPSNRVYLYDGKRDGEFSSFSELKSFISPFRTSVSKVNVIYGSGGPLAGIHHGSDCERFVMPLQDQNYLVYLDSKNVVQASFPIKSVSNDFLEGAATLFLTPPVSPTTK